MKTKLMFKHTLLILRNIVILILLLEFSLGSYHTLKTWYAKHKKINTIVDSNLYPNLNSSTIKTIFKELYSQNMQWESYTHYKFKPFNGTYNKINNNGLRNTLRFNSNSAKKTYKIFCFGGSTMYGSGARDSYTIPSELSKLLYTNYPNTNIEITNYGCHGYVRSTENITLQKELLLGNIPDLVIFYDGVNDVVSTFQNNKAGLPSNSINRKNEFNTSISYAGKIHTLLKKSYIYKTATQFTSKHNNMQIASKKLAQDIEKNFLGNILITEALSKTYHFKVLNFLQPNIYTKSNIFNIEKQAYKDTKYYRPLFTETYKTIRKTLNRTQNKALDFSSIFNTYNKALYSDFCHTNEIGNAIVAKEMYNIIKDSIVNTKL